MKKLTAILFLSTLLLTVLGYFFIFQLRLQQAKAEMKTYLLLHEHKDVAVFSISIHNKTALAQFQWEGNNEFELEGRMYDVIEKKIVKDHLIIRCLSDEKETNLLKAFTKLHKQTNDPTSQKCASIHKLIDTWYEPPIPMPTVRLLTTSIDSYTPYHFIYASYSSNVPTPPPQLS